MDSPESIEIATAAFPFVPAELSTAHIASTYLPADIYRRLREVLGRRCLLVSAIDVHSAQASLDGKTRSGIQQKVIHYEQCYRRQMEAFDICFDVFERTDHPFHLQTVDDVLRALYRAGAIEQRNRDVWQCISCEAFPPLRLTHNDKRGQYSIDEHPERCPYCSGSKFKRQNRPHWYMHLEPHRSRLQALNYIINPKAVHAWVDHTLREPLMDWNFSRDNSVGLPLPFGLCDQSLYLWFESVLGYISMAHLATEHPSRFMHFHGKNIIWHHSVIWPVLLEAGCDIDASTIRNSVRGFLDTQASDSELLDIKLTTQTYPVDYLRFYLSASVPTGCSDFIISISELERTCNTRLCNKIGNVLRRAQILLLRAGDRPRQHGHEALVSIFTGKVVPKLEYAMEFGDIRMAVDIVVAYASELNYLIHRERLFNDQSEQSLAKLAYAITSLLTIAAPIIPTLAREGSPFSDWIPSTIANINEALARPLNGNVVYWPKIGFGR